MRRKKLTYTLEEAQKRLEKYCAYQDRCHWEVERKLDEMRMIPQAKEIILLHLMQHDFLNEVRFTKSFVGGKFRIKQWGKRRIINELKKRNISEYNIRTGLKEIDEDAYFETLRNLAKNQADRHKKLPEYQKKQKIYRFLVQKGFESNLITEVLQDVLSGQ